MVVCKLSNLLIRCNDNIGFGGAMDLWGVILAYFEGDLSLLIWYE